MPRLGPETHRLTRRLFLVLLAAVYATAFASLWLQVEGLIGSRGIAPAAELLARAREQLGGGAFARVPTLLWLGSSDAALHGLCAAGVAAALLLALGVAPRLALAALWALYLSCVSVGGPFLSYQWDALLLETGALAVLLAPGGLAPRRAAEGAPSAIALWLLRLLLFKLMLLSGVVKWISEDATWRGLTALHFHYWTQPLPAWTSWYAHQLPGVLHSAGALATLAIEIALPFAIFLRRGGRVVAFAGFALLQVAIGLTGNYGFFNALTLALCALLLDDAVLRRVLPARLCARLAPEPPPTAASPRGGWLPRVALAGVAVALVALSASRALESVGAPLPRPAWFRAAERGLAPFRSINAYGLFAVMTTERNEIELQGSDDGRSWKSYGFRWKPGPPERAPRFVQPHMPRLDWQLWFAALRGCPRAPWLPGFFERVLQGEPGVLALMGENPFPEAPPRQLRTRLHAYRFAPGGSEGLWWQRTLRGGFCPKVTLEGGRLVPVGPDGAGPGGPRGR